MDALKRMYAELGFINIQTYIQSGNVVFQAGPSTQMDLAMKIAKKIIKTVAFEVPVIVLDFADLQAVVDNNPFIGDLSKDESFLHVTFLATLPEPKDRIKLNDIHYPGEEFVVNGKSIYLYCPNGYGNTKLNNNFFENKLKVEATTRNWRTTKELLNIARKLTPSRP